MTADAPGNWAGHPLLDTVANLWPTARVSIAPGRRAPGPKELIYVPNSDDPRLLVPAGHRRAASAALLRFNHFLPIGERLRRVLAAGGLRLGAERLLAHRIALVERETAPDSIETYLSEALGQDVVVSLGIGLSRATQKPVLQAFDCSGRSLAFVKIGDNAHTRELVRTETEALRRLAQQNWTALDVPRLMHSGNWHSFEVLVMSILPVRARPALRRPVSVAPVRPMREFTRAFSEGLQVVATSGLMQRLRADVRGIADEVTASTYCQALDRIADRYRHTVLHFAAWHGDWSPWNMAWRGRRVQLWDWERFETGVPAGMDRTHYVLSALARTEGFSARTIVRALELPSAREYARPSQQDVLGLLYLAAIVNRYLTSSHHEHPGPVQARAGAALEALSWLSQKPGRLDSQVVGS
jgi:hypothetical protein